jgi:subtilisin family serine protease
MKHTQVVAAVAAALLLAQTLPARGNTDEAPRLLTQLRLGPTYVHTPGKEAFVPGEVLVKFRQDIATKNADPLSGDLGLVRVERIERLDVNRYRLEQPGDCMETVRQLRQRPDVLYAEPNSISYPTGVPNDTFYAGYDGHPTDLQRWTFGGVGSDPSVNAERAWEITTGRTDVTIAIVDSGVAPWHLDLRDNLWSNGGEVPNNGLDDDRNGYVDDAYGWDFYWDDADPSPDLGNGYDEDGDGGADNTMNHGTFVAACAAARGNDGYGTCGSAWHCTIMPLKVFTDDGVAFGDDIAEAIYYAADNGADVINLSLGSLYPSLIERDAIQYAVARNCVVVAAAGNGNTPDLHYPSSFEEVLSVGASDHGFAHPYVVEQRGSSDMGGRAPYSQFGPAAVDVVAPGTVLGPVVVSVAEALADRGLSPGDLYVDAKGGTSFASPIVAGLAALIVSRDKDLHSGARTLSPSRIIEIIEGTASDLPDDQNDWPDAGASWDNHGRVDFFAALSAVSAPAAPTGLHAPGIGRKRIVLNWTGGSNDATGFAVALWTGVAWQEIGALSGAATSAVIRRLIPGRTYYVTVRAFNGSGSSPYAEPIQVTTRG